MSKPSHRHHVQIVAEVHVNELMRVLRDATINRDDFNADPWSLYDAECLESAARLIRREIAEKERERKG